MTTKDKLIEATAQACAIIHEQLPDNNFIVSIFGDDGGETLSQTFRGKMSPQALAALLNATIDSLAEATKADRTSVIATLLVSENPIKRKEDL